MAKLKSAYVCNDCGTEHGQWQGQCASCGEWNTLSKINLGPANAPSAAANFKRQGITGSLSSVTTLNDINLEDQPRIATGIGEFDRVLGEGIVPGSAVLIGGNPGAGKSTLLLQILCKLSQDIKALYVTGEESLQQVAMRAKRLDLPTNKLLMLAETNINEITNLAQEHQPKLIVIDSIQVMHSAEIASAPGSVSQVRECAAYLVQYAKQTNTAIFFVGHVTKDGNLAGPKVLEHMIDCFVMLEGGDDSRYRTLRGQKNRFGAVNELGVFCHDRNRLKRSEEPIRDFSCSYRRNFSRLIGHSFMGGHASLINRNSSISGQFTVWKSTSYCRRS